MMSSRLPSLIVALLVSFLSAGAAAEVAVSDAWVRGTVAGQMGTGAFMRLTSSSDTTLVGVASPAARVVELHQMKMEGSMMKMSAIARLSLPAGKAVLLEPRGYHVMLMDLARPLKEGDIVPLSLTFEDKTGKKQTIDVKATVRALGK